MESQGEWGAEKRRVVVIGGGVAGSLVAKSLQFKSDLTLIDPKEYFEIPWASLRAMVEPSSGERSVINHKDYLTNSRIVTSHAVSVTKTEVLTAEGRLIPYDYLVIATGHKDPVPKTRTRRLTQYETEHENIRSARSILIVGGGPSGVELAGEISVDFPEKKVILVHSGHRLLEFMGPKGSDKALEWLRSKNVEVRLEQSVDFNTVSDGGRAYPTSVGEIIRVDCCFLCTGRPLGSSWLKGTVLEDKLDADGRLMVDKQLRVKGHKNTFAIGDITDVQEMKQGYLAQKHALVAAKNVCLSMKGSKESKMETYEPRTTKTVVSLGRREAVAQWSFTTAIGHVPGMIKSKDLFVGKTRKLIGLEPRTLLA